MALNYAEGKSLASNLLADLNTAILASTDWTRPNAAAHPSLYKATTTRGADMVIDLADAAIVNTRLQVSAYTSYDGTTLGVKLPNARYLTYKYTNTGAVTTNYVYWWLSVSKEHFFLMVEGPRPQDANSDNGTYGSPRSCLFMEDLVPYFGTTVDPNPAVVASGFSTTTGTSSTAYFDHKAIVNRTIGGLNWNMGSLLTLEYPSNQLNFADNRVGPDGNLFLAPYVYFDDADGIRGRLNNIFYAGINNNQGDNNPNISNIPAPNSFTTYNGQKYKLLACQYNGYSNVNGVHFNALGAFVGATSGNDYYSPLVAVPCL